MRINDRVAASGRSPATPHDVGHRPLTRAQKLAQDAAEAAEIRAYQSHPDVVVLRVERVRAQVDRLCWAGIVLGLAFTASNVQQFAAAHSQVWSLPWLAAWLLDPMVSLVLLAILRAEQITARYRVRTGLWVRVAKWLTLGATYLMNTWQSYVDGSASAVVLHSVPPLIVLAAAEAVTDLRDKLTAAAEKAFIDATRPDAVNGTSVHEPGATDGTVAAGGGAKSVRRKSFQDYLSEARQAWSPDVVITAAWIREVTACSRGLSSRLAHALAAEVDAQRQQDGGV